MCNKDLTSATQKGEKKRRWWWWNLKFLQKKNIIIESYLFSFSYRHMFSSSLLPIRTKAFLSWPHSPHDYPQSSSEAMIMPTVMLFSLTYHHLYQHLGLVVTHSSRCRHSHASLLCKWYFFVNGQWCQYWTNTIKWELLLFTHGRRHCLGKLVCVLLFIN